MAQCSALVLTLLLSENKPLALHLRKGDLRLTDTDQPKFLSGGGGESPSLSLAAVLILLCWLDSSAPGSSQRFPKVNPSPLSSLGLEAETLTSVHRKWPSHQRRQRRNSLALPLLGSTAIFILAVQEAF